MKKVIFIFSFCFLSQFIFSQKNTQIKNLAAYCKYWGFLKYYHPIISKSNLDWDSALCSDFPKVVNVRTKVEFNNILLSISNRLGSVPQVKTPFIAPDSCSKNANFNWMNDTSEFNQGIIAYLNNIKSNKAPFENKYVQPEKYDNARLNENTFKDSTNPSIELRYLSVARYWNIINYYFPDKYLMDDNWDSSLVNAIPLFLNASDKDEYFRAIEWIVARTNDSHATWVTPPTYDTNVLAKRLPFTLYLHNDTLAVIYLSNDSLCKILDIKAGDIILKINDKPVIYYWKEMQKYYSASNIERLENNSVFLLMPDILHFSHKNTCTAEISRENKIITRELKLFPIKSSRFTINNTTIHSKRAFNIFTDSVSHKKIGYIDASTWADTNTYETFKQLKGVGYLIIDFRHGENGHIAGIADYFFRGKIKFSLMTRPNYDHPGYFNYFTPMGGEIASYVSEIYSGKVILLANHSNQSHDEYVLMLFKAATKGTIIGTRTAGADGDISTVYFPGNYSVWFSGLGVFYPDGKETQRIGIVPDILIDYSIYSQVHHIDTIFKRAVEYIRNGR